MGDHILCACVTIGHIWLLSLMASLVNAERWVSVGLVSEVIAHVVICQSQRDDLLVFV